MPQPHGFDPSTPPPLGQRRCPSCGLPMFLSTVEPSEHDDYEERTFECSTCCYAETVAVKFR
jgi:hypothetical protein